MNMFGYGTITSSKPIRNVQNVTIYKKLRSFFLAEDAIYIDVLSERDNARPKLNFLMETMHQGDVLVLATIKSLGTMDKEIKTRWKKIVLQRGINILIPDYNKEPPVGEFSTCDFSCIRFTDDVIDEITKVLEKKQFQRTTSDRGRKAANIDKQFIKAYWRYQNFFVTTDQAVGESGVSRQTFYRLLKKYEDTDDYKKELLRQDAEAQIHLKPKRGGGEPDQLQQILFDVENLGMDLDSACSKCGISMKQIEYERFKLFYLHGKKGLAEAMEQYAENNNEHLQN